LTEPALHREARAEQRPITAMRGVGDALAERLQRLGVTQVQDLLFVLPLRYEDRTQVVPIGALLPGTRVAVEGEVQLTEVVFRRKRQLLCRLSDGSGFLTLRFFYFSGAQQNALARGTRLRCFGEIRRGPQGLEIVHPEYRRVAGDGPSGFEETLTPIYPGTEGLAQGRMRALINEALKEVSRASVRDWVPSQVLDSLALPALKDALDYVHNPPREARLEELAAGRHPAQRRLAFEELLAHHLSLKLLKNSSRTEPAMPLEDPEQLAKRFIESLPFSMTGAQARALREVDADLLRNQPAVRLIQGDVGCGKTIVAAAAAARAAGSGRQAVLMAPTELLAEQHWRNFCQWFHPLHLPVALVSGSQPAKVRKSALEAIANGDVRIIVGTHALFQEGIDFSNLALIIVDEQHRFGVQQRLRMQEKGRKEGRFPHQLIMTATPIPRTLAMTAYADLDISVIDELPQRRLPRRTTGVLGVPADRRIGRGALAGRRRHRRTAGRSVAGSARGPRARAHAAREERSGDARLQVGQDPAARRDHGHRSRRRRAQCHTDGHRECRAHGPCAASPASRSRWAGRRSEQLRASLSQPALAARARAAQGDS
jgi:ATP-dependent DNA helicase RecG